MTNTQLATYISSPVFVATLIALVRGRVPSLAGNWVLLVSFVLNLACCVGATLLTDPHAWLTGIGAGVAAFVASSGGADLLRAASQPATPTAPKGDE